jgi:hypothetical protein
MGNNSAGVKGVPRGSQSHDGSQSDSTPVMQEKTMEKAVEQQQVRKSPSNYNGLIFDLKYKDVICYNRGEPCHYVGMCSKPKKCFICGSQMHHMDKCPDWYRSMPMAQVYGSASSVMGFFHVEVDKPAAMA